MSKAFTLAALLLGVATAQSRLAPTPDAQAVLRGTLAQLGAGKLDAALANFAPDFRTPAWRQMFAAARGLKVQGLAPSRPELWSASEREFKVAYAVKGGAVTLKNSAVVSLTQAPGGEWRISGWDKLPPPRLTVGAEPLTPGVSVTLRGGGFAPNAAVEARLGPVAAEGEVLAQGKTDAQGFVELALPVPASQDGAPLLDRQLEVSLSGGRLRIARRVAFAPALSTDDLSGQYAGPGMSFRFPGAYEVRRGEDGVTLLDARGRVALSAALLPRAPATEGMSPEEYAGQFGTLFPEALGAEVQGVKPFEGAASPAFSLQTGDGLQSVLLSCGPQGKRWLLLRAGDAFAPVLESVARTVKLECTEQ